MRNITYFIVIKQLLEASLINSILLKSNHVNRIMYLFTHTYDS